MCAGCVPPGAWAGEGLCSRPGQGGSLSRTTALSSRRAPSPAFLPAVTSGAHASLGLGGGGQPRLAGQLCPTFPQLPGPPGPTPSRSLHICAAHLARTTAWCPPHLWHRRLPLPWGLGAGDGPSPEPLAQQGRLWLHPPGHPRGHSGCRACPTYLRGSGRTRAGRRRGASRGRPAPRARAQGRRGAWRPPSPGCR